MKGLREEAAAALPYLRRYARALTGSQQHGDQWVRLCVEVLLQQPDLLGSKSTTTAEVFALFHKLQQPFSALEPESAGEATDAPARLKTHLTDIPVSYTHLTLPTNREV